ncbi:MAG: CopG family transcriptional regulator [Candidatus Omnitrophica bacterium]|nr:CopG family transcriptional regulator [Candidatus Omnitrophota bacterium]
MTEMTKRTTVYLDSKLHRAIKIKAIQISTSISNIVNEALRLSLKEDAIDFQAVKDRAQEPSRSFEAVLKDLKRDGLL